MVVLRWLAIRMNYRFWRSSIPLIQFGDTKSARSAFQVTVAGFVRCTIAWIKLRLWLKKRLPKPWSRSCLQYRENGGRFADFQWSPKF